MDCDNIFRILPINPLCFQSSCGLVVQSPFTIQLRVTQSHKHNFGFHLEPESSQLSPVKTSRQQQQLATTTPSNSSDWLPQAKGVEATRVCITMRVSSASRKPVV